MATPAAAGDLGRINGLHRATPIRNRHPRVRHAAQAPLVAVGSGLYAVALLFPLVLKQVTPLAYLAAFLGSGLLLFGLHLRWSRGKSR